MASSSNPHDTSARIDQDLEYLYASNANVSNFVSVKLSSKGNYRLWRTQMICLMKSHNMGGIVDAKYTSPRASSKETMEQYDSLLKGWIFGSVSENLLGGDIVDLDLAKDVWDRLKSSYDATIDPQQGLGPSKSEGKTEIKEKNGQDTVAIEIIGKDLVRTQSKTEREERIKQNLSAATMKGNWLEAESILKDNKHLAKEAISDDGSTMLHIAVGIGHIDFVKDLFWYLKDEELLVQRTSDGFTALHIAAGVGNTEAVDLLVKKNKKLLEIKDKKEEEPVRKAYNNMHIATLGYLLNAVGDKGSVHPYHPGVKIGVDLVVNAIFAKQYDLASNLVKKFPNFALENDEVLMAIAKTFPTGLEHEEQLIYPSFDNILVLIKSTWTTFLILLFILPISLHDHFFGSRRFRTIAMMYNLLLCTVPFMIGSIFVLIFLLILVVCFSFLLVYSLLWKGLATVVPYIKHVENKKKEFDGAQKVLELVCDQIDKLEFSGTHHPHYNQPFLEAARNNALKVVDEIFSRAPQAIHTADKSGYDIIQLAIINRSEKIYNLIYDIGEQKNLHRTFLDSSKNNTLHLAARLAPSHALNKRTGAALQLQRELQWREEVKKLVFPTYLIQENIFNETPDMVFTREHANLVKEGEQWMKTTAESCSITAALITTVVFAAAITVPGGSNQETGIPLFKERTGFVIFAVSNAISLFSSIVFLSILTARYAEKDFLVSLPRRLLIGVFSLLVSASTMMIAFTSILYLVFCDQNSWMLVPICGLAIIPVAFFTILQFPLIVDLFWSTNMQIFGRRGKSVMRRFNLEDLRMIFK